MTELTPNPCHVLIGQNMPWTSIGDLFADAVHRLMVMLHANTCLTFERLQILSGAGIVLVAGMECLTNGMA